MGDLYGLRRDIDRLIFDVYNIDENSLRLVDIDKYNSDMSSINDNISYLTEQVNTHRYYYDIRCSEYNVDIDSEITVTIVVSDDDNELVPNYEFNLLLDDELLTTLTTDETGTVTYNYTCNEFGIHTFSVNEYKISIKVSGWKSYPSTTTGFSIKYNEDYCSINLNYPSNHTLNHTYDLITLAEGYRPDIAIAVPLATISSNGETYGYLRVFIDGRVQIILSKSTYSSDGGINLIGGVIFPRRKL